MTNEPTLERCPLCGNLAKYVYLLATVGTACTGCGLALPGEENHVWDQFGGHRPFDPRPSLASKWNRRSGK